MAAVGDLTRPLLFFLADLGLLSVTQLPDQRGMHSSVVKKDTASCNISHGSRAKINAKTIMKRSTVVNKDNEETDVMCSTVVERDTASRGIYHGGSRAKINAKTIISVVQL